jgi:integrase
MATVRKRTWVSGGKTKTAWICDYFDQNRVRRQRTCKTKREAEDWLLRTRGEIKTGTHTPDSTSMRVVDAVQLWIDRCTLRIDLAGDEKLEWTTVQQYRTHLDHIAKSSIATVKLSRLGMPMVEAFKDELLAKRISPATARKILTSLKTALTEAQRRGLVAQNVATDVKYGRRTKPKIVEGVDLLTKIELQAILAHAGKWYPLLATAAFTGMRASELRGLRWGDVDFDNKLVHVRRRADQRRMIGDPKSVGRDAHDPAYRARRGRASSALVKGQVDRGRRLRLLQQPRQNRFLSRLAGPRLCPGSDRRRHRSPALRAALAAPLLWIVAHRFAAVLAEGNPGDARARDDRDDLRRLWPPDRQERRGGEGRSRETRSCVARVPADCDINRRFCDMGTRRPQHCCGFCVSNADQRSKSRSQPKAGRP